MLLGNGFDREITRLVTIWSLFPPCLAFFLACLKSNLNWEFLPPNLLQTLVCELWPNSEVSKLSFPLNLPSCHFLYIIESLFIMTSSILINLLAFTFFFPFVSSWFSCSWNFDWVHHSIAPAYYTFWPLSRDQNMMGYLLYSFVKFSHESKESST